MAYNLNMAQIQISFKVADEEPVALCEAAHVGKKISMWYVTASWSLDKNWNFELITVIAKGSVLKADSTPGKVDTPRNAYDKYSGWAADTPERLRTAVFNNAPLGLGYVEPA